MLRSNQVPRRSAPVEHASVRRLLVGDDDGAIAAGPQALGPDVKPPGFLGDVGIHELHEQCELAGARRGQQEVRMRGEEHEGMDGHAIDGLGLADDAEDEVGELGRGLE